MTQEQFEQRQERATRQPFLISRTDEGFRVYSSNDSGVSYLVSGSREVPFCTCPDFRAHRNDPAWRCKHILAVLNHVNGTNPVAEADETDRYAIEERLAIQQEGPLLKQEADFTPRKGASQMLIKRSVSPDGRIDSLSIEFSCSVEDTPVREITERALNILELQGEIAEHFLNGHAHENNQPDVKEKSVPAAAAIPAQMINIGGMDTKRGWRIFINIRANSRTLKLFGTRKQLAETINAIGFPEMAEHIEEGMYLNLPCQIITKPSEDGRYLNIERVMPLEMPPSQRKAR